MNKHTEAVAAFEQGDAQKALRLLGELIQDGETSELWSDWATVQSACGDLRKAETGFSRALELEPDNQQAKANLGLLLIGLGDPGRGMPLLEESLPSLPDAQRELLRAAVDAATKGLSSRHPAGALRRPRQIALIHDVFPQSAGDAEPEIIRMARVLRELGHDIVLLVRDGRRRERFEPSLKRLGIRVFADDAEHLGCIGRDIPSSPWSFAQLLAENDFALAILTQDFARGFSIPEQYIDDIRKHSPGTRIAILSDELRGRTAAGRASRSGEFKDHEVARDWAHREWEGFLRADLIVVSQESDAQSLSRENPTLEIAITPPPRCSPKDATAMAAIVDRALRLNPKPAANTPFSATLVDLIYASRLAKTAGQQRVYARLDFYLQFAEQLLRQGRPEFAREQLRHVFGWLGDSIKLTPALAQPLSLLNRCYRTLEDNVMAARCAEEARHCFAGTGVEHRSGTPAIATRDNNGPRFSLIVPSYNRLPILRKCLAALEVQTISPSQFEVIVIDDGSSDGTEDAMSSYQPPFRFQYLRQTNSGTGAARRNGVAHATGEYLLLMNDDTICNPTVLEEHLRAQHAYSSQRWAVLGNFEYPAEARQRALTHFLRVNSFMFPQVDMAEGCPYAYSHFITCNLSIRRDAVVRAGSFDSTYKLSEDTELGIRLFEMGYGVIYHPAARAWHDHLPYAVANLIRRARVYGADYFYMFRNHPRVTKEWAMPIRLNDMDERDAAGILSYLEKNRAEVQAAVAALERWDSVDFEPLLADPRQTAHILSLFQQAVPAIHWFYLFESMLETLTKELSIPRLAAGKQFPSKAAHTS